MKICGLLDSILVLTHDLLCVSENIHCKCYRVLGWSTR
jgi:hypothetical protein